MRKLIYITNDGWWDTDISLLPQLTKDYDVEVYVVSHAEIGKNKYPQKVLPKGIKLHNLSFERSKKDIRTLFYSIIYSLKLVYVTYNKLVFWETDINPYYSIPFMFLVKHNRTIVSFHDYLLHIDAPKWQKKLRDLFVRKFEYFHFHSQIQEQEFKKENYKKISFSTVMPPKSFGRPTGKTFFDNTKRTFLFFGFIRDYKRLDLFIQAANKYNKIANFIIAGNCKDWFKYEKLINSSSPNILCHIRFVKNEEIADYFCQSNFLVLPYDDSTQSGPLLTAYYYNLPTIASNLPYFKGMIEDNCDGFLFTQGSASDFMDKIDRAIKMNDKEYNNMKHELEKRVVEYSKQSNFCEMLSQFIEKHSL